MRQREIYFLGRSLLLYMLSFLLLLEWLVPLPYVTDTGFIPLFIICTLFFFMVTFLQLPLWLSMILKTCAILFGIHFMFFAENLFSIKWLLLYAEDLVYNMKLLFTGQLMHLSNMFRSSLFFILLAMMSDLLYYWTVVAKRALFFFVFTAIFVTVIDTFTDYDASFAIVRIFIIGFMLLGLVTMYRMIEKRRITVHSFLLPARLIAVLTFAVICASALGFVAPKLEPQWEDPVPYMKAVLGLAPSFSSAQKVGYSDDDERLGGGFQQDDTTVFYATAEKPTYWRGEAKEYYTGHGWSSTEDHRFVLGIEPSLYEGKLKTERRQAELHFARSPEFYHLFYLGEMTKLLTPSEPYYEFMTNLSTGKIYSYEHSDAVKLEGYSFEYESPEFSVPDLRAVPDEMGNQIYLQLPETLPERVRELAADIVKDELNRFDKVKAIERYFRTNGFRYETEDVAIPNENQDYVDQFLFETKQGYCDNFSTSMVVLLRSVDIPARWVKGFTQGKETGKTEDGRKIYKVTNANAHSWVEVYFPDYGWIPFEPTQSFYTPFVFNYGEEEPDLDELTVEKKEKEDRLENEQKEDNRKKEMSGSTWTVSLLSIIVLTVLLATIIVLYKMRWKLMAQFLLRRYFEREDEGAFEQAYTKLLALLSRRGHRRGKHETIREYAKKIDELYGSHEMSQLTEQYEQAMYGRESAVTLWHKNRHLWKVVVERIGS